MKKEFLTSYAELNKDELQQLCTIVSETLALGIVLPEAKEKKSNFGVADLWNLQRKMNTAVRRWNNRSWLYFIRG